MDENIKKSQNIVNLNKEDNTTVDFKQSIIGFAVFFCIFVLLIPMLLFKNKHYSILGAYMPNLDIVATVITWHGGPFNIWKHLYPPSPLSLYGFSSQTVINYIALLGLTFIITSEVKRTNSMARGWSMAFVMLLMTYLLPGQFISWLMDRTYDVAKNFKIGFIDSTWVVLLIGFLIATTIISVEAFILIKFKQHLTNIAYNIMNIPKLLKK